MCRKLLLLLLVLIQLSDSAKATQYAYQINFHNKTGTLPFSDSLTFLTTRSLARRTAQGIALDSTDLPVTKAYVDSVLVLTGGKLHCKSKWMNLCVILIFDSTKINTLNGLSFISSKKLVGIYSDSLHKNAHEETEPDYAANKTTTTDATYYAQSWQQSLMVNGNYLHDLSYKGSGKIIAVLDAGFVGTNTHSGFDSLRTSGRIIDQHNFTLASNNIYAYDNHGTEVLSTMAGYVPDTFVGSAPLASYALYITEDDNSEQPIELLNMLCSAERADSIGADVITTSLGYSTFDNAAYNFTYAPDLDGKTTIAAKTANMATQKGMLFIATAGNEGGNTWNNVLTPGDADSALTIGNVDITGTCAYNSGYGPNAAGQIKPDVCTLGQPGAVFNAGGGYMSINGTSISTPEIAGWATCLWQAVPHATPATLRRAIISCASHYASPGTQIGYGIPNFKCAAIQLNVVDTPFPQNDMSILIPNPATQSLNIIVTLRTAQEVSFRLMDLAGREIMLFSSFFDSGINKQVSYNIATLPNGMYFLKATAGNNRQVLKLVKQ